MAKPIRLKHAIFVGCIFVGNVTSTAQCPNTGETKVIRPASGGGYCFLKLLGADSFEYYLDGTEISYNDKDNPGVVITTIDGIDYQSMVIEKSILKKLIKETTSNDLLLAQAKSEQAYFVSIDPDTAITDYGPATSPGITGHKDRIFYLWKKERASKKGTSRQYLCSTEINNIVAILSIMPNKSIPEPKIFEQIKKYTSSFNMLSAARVKELIPN